MKKNSTVTGFIAGVVVSVIVCSVFTLVYFKPFSHGGKSDSISEKLALIEKEIDSEFYKKYGQRYACKGICKGSWRQVFKIYDGKGVCGVP